MVDSTSRCSLGASDPEQVWSCFRQHTTGLAAVCAQVDGAIHAMIVSTFLPVSVDPPLVAISISDLSKSWNYIRQAQRIGVSILSVEHEDFARALSSKTPGWEHLWPMTKSPHQAVFLDCAIVAMECSIHESIAAGDHTIPILKIHEIIPDPDRHLPLLYHEGRITGMMSETLRS